MPSNGDTENEEYAEEIDMQSTEGFRKKSTPFSTLETDVLLELVGTRKLIVESHKTDFGSINKNKRAWLLIEEEFNSDPGTSTRTHDQLKKKWENLKRLAKKDISTNKREIKVTGGGPAPKPIKINSMKVTSIIPSQMEGLINEFDCDAETENQAMTNGISDDLTTTSVKVLEVQKPNKPKDKVTPEDMKRKRSDPRSCLADWEYEEHKIRMRTLAVSYEVELERLKKVKLEITALNEDKEQRQKLIMAQIQQLNNSTLVFSNNQDHSSGIRQTPEAEVIFD